MTTSTPSPSELRIWAQKNGITVADRGRISADVLDAWNAARQSAPATTTATTKATSAAVTPKRSASATPSNVRELAARRPTASPTEAEQSRIAESEARITDLEQRVRVLEDRLVQVENQPASKPKGRLFHRT